MFQMRAAAKKSSADNKYVEEVAVSAAAPEDPKSRRQKEIEATKKLLDIASQILKDADESSLLQERELRQYPKFSREELKFGPVLGVGGFGIVFEIKDITLNLPEEVEVKTERTTTNVGDVTWDGGMENSDESAEHADGSEDAPAQKSPSPRRHVSDESHTTATTTFTIPNGVNYLDAISGSPRTRVEITGLLDLSHDDSHYDIKHAREHMAEHARRNGEARYAVKRLHRELTDLERARGMIDLALETKYLSAVWHPNIIKMRGISAAPMLSKDFFIILDRLYGTLVDKMGEWKRMQVESQGRMFGIGAKPQELKQLMLDRMIVAYDLAAAFWYMHDKKLVYRDVKQENIGFDIRGDVKVFDLGLCKCLSPALKAKEGYGYILTPRTGSIPYMAPEVTECHPYDFKCDVFSFSVLLWEMLSLKTAFQGYSRREFLERVVRGKERPIVAKNWPSLTRLMMKEAWHHDPQQRPDMKRVAVMLRSDLNEMTTDSKVQDRTQHLKEQSARSFRITRGLSSSFRIRIEKK